MADKPETEQFVDHKQRSRSPEQHNCRYRWWHQDFRSQRVIAEIIESNYFRALVIFLVVADTALVITEIMLDSFKIHYECGTYAHHLSKHEVEVVKHRIEVAMEVAHYSSIAILTFFFVELLVRMYVFGEEFWNLRRKKMEYLDAFIVVTSLIIDLSFLRGEKKIVGEQLLLILSFRLWRFVRIISSVGEGIRHGQRKHKGNLNQQYLLVTRRLIDLIKHKTAYLDNHREHLDDVLEHFRLIDNQCDTSFEGLDQNHTLTSSAIVVQFLDEMNGIENKNKDSVIEAMLVKPSLV